MAEGTSFHRVMYDDALPSDPKKAKQLVLCSGKIYYELLEEREKRGLEEVHFLRLEQLYPFPYDALTELLTPYKHCDLVWCQEEPRNKGAWSFVEPFIEELADEIGFKEARPRYAGRMSAASPATGSASRHAAEQAELIDEALTLGKKRMGRVAARKARYEASSGKAASSTKSRKAAE